MDTGWLIPLSFYINTGSETQKSIINLFSFRHYISYQHNIPNRTFHAARDDIQLIPPLCWKMTRA
jgi:hypothetical protein